MTSIENLKAVAEIDSDFDRYIASGGGDLIINDRRGWILTIHPRCERCDGPPNEEE